MSPRIGLAKIYLLFVLLPLVIIACATIYHSVGVLPATDTSSPTHRITSLTSSTPTVTPQPTRLPIHKRLIPNPTHPQITLQATATPSPLELQQRVFQAVWETVKDTYLYPDFNGLDWDAVHARYLAIIQAGVGMDEFYPLIDQMIYELDDDHSFYLSPEQVEKERVKYEEGYSYVGIGVVITALPERELAIILSVLPGSPAEAGGLRARDAILTANEEPILNEDGSLKMIIRGPEGTQVTILAQTPGEAPRQLTLTRQAIISHLPVPRMLLTSSQGVRVGYILLTTLADSTIDEQFREALQELSADAPLDGLIIDNTQNGGGIDTVVRPILGFFTSGTVGYFISHEGERPFHISNPEDIQGSQQLPLVILNGHHTASFGEVFSGVLQDMQRAYVIGEITDGNVETLSRYDFEDGSRLWLARESFRPLNNLEANWEETGIIPDLQLPVQWDQYTVENDPLVQAALKYFDDLQP